jgi:hypothetical protein
LKGLKCAAKDQQAKNKQSKAHKTGHPFFTIQALNQNSLLFKSGQNQNDFKRLGPGLAKWLCRLNRA